MASLELGTSDTETAQSKDVSGHPERTVQDAV